MGHVLVMTPKLKQYSGPLVKIQVAAIVMVVIGAAIVAALRPGILCAVINHRIMKRGDTEMYSPFFPDPTILIT